MLACGHDVMRKRAEKQDDSAVVILVLVLVAIALSFWTIFGVLSEAKQVSGQTKALHVSLAAGTILMYWLVTQVVFTFHYAHEFYRPDEGGERIAKASPFPAATGSPTIGISSTSPRRSAPPRRPPTSPSSPSRCAGSSPCMR